MKSFGIIFSTLLILSITACQQQEVESDSGGEDIKQIASNFRSESDIVVEPGTENYMGHFDHKGFIEDVFQAIFDGNIQAYDFLDNPMSIEDVKYIYSHQEAAEVEDIETGAIDSIMIEESLNPDDVVKIFTTEDWYFDKKNFKIEKKVVSITFTTLKFDLDGEPIGFEILFKVFFDGRDQLP